MGLRKTFELILLPPSSEFWYYRYALLSTVHLVLRIKTQDSMHAKQTVCQLNYISSFYNIPIYNQKNQLIWEDVIKIHKWFLNIIIPSKIIVYTWY